METPEPQGVVTMPLGMATFNQANEGGCMTYTSTPSVQPSAKQPPPRSSCNPPTRRLHFDLSVSSEVSYAKLLEEEKKKCQQGSTHDLEPGPDSIESLSSPEDSSSNSGNEGPEEASPGSEMEDTTCANDAAVVSGGEDGMRVSGGQSSGQEESRRKQRRRAKCQKLVTYEADFVDDTEVLEARAATKEPKYGSTSNGFYVNEGRIETLEDEVEAKEAAKGKSKPPRAPRTPHPTAKDHSKHGVVSAGEQQPAAPRKRRKPEAEQTKHGPATKKVKKAEAAPAKELLKMPSQTAPAPPAAPPAPAPPADVYPPNMSLAQKAALAGKLASSKGPATPKPTNASTPTAGNPAQGQPPIPATTPKGPALPGSPAILQGATGAAAPTPSPKAAQRRTAAPQQTAAALSSVGPLAAATGAAAPAATQAAPSSFLAGSKSIAAASSPGPAASGGAAQPVPQKTLAERKAAAAQKQLERQQQQQHAEQGKALPTGKQDPPVPPICYMRQDAPSIKDHPPAADTTCAPAAAAADVSQPTPPTHRKAPGLRSFKGTNSLVETITTKLCNCARDASAQEPSASTLKQGLKNPMSNLAMSLYRDGNPQEKLAAVTRALAKEGGTLWADEEAVAAEIKVLQDRHLLQLEGLRDDLKVKLTSGSGIMQSPTGADGATEQDLTPQAFGVWEKLLPLHLKLCGVSSKASLLREVASWGEGQSLQVSTLEHALDKHKKHKEPKPPEAGPAEAGGKGGKPSGKNMKTKVSTAATHNNSNPQQQQPTTTATHNNSSPDGAAPSSRPSKPQQQTQTDPGHGTASADTKRADVPAAEDKKAPHDALAQHAAQHASISTQAQATPPRASQAAAAPHANSHVQGRGNEPQTVNGSSPPASPRRRVRQMDRGTVAAAGTTNTNINTTQAPAEVRAGGATGSAARSRAKPVVDTRVGEEVPSPKSAAGAGDVSPSSGAEGEVDGTSGPADEEGGPAAGAASGAGGNGKAGTLRGPAPGEDTVQLEAALEQASSKGGDAQLLREHYTALQSVYSRAVLKALCYAGAQGFSTKHLRAHIQEHNYLPNWKGDIGSINQAIKAKNMPAAIAHIGDYMYAARAFPEVNGLEQEKPVKAERHNPQQQQQPSGPKA